MSAKGWLALHCRLNCFTALSALISAAALFAPPAANSQSASSASSETSGTLEEIVITAQKRTEKLEDVPVSAAVVSAESVARNNVTDISDLNNLVPSVNLNGSFNGRVPSGMRGISSVSNEGTVGLSSGVAILVDGVPVPSDSVDGNQLEDIQSIEVLKGPQATLGGRTAASGVINIVTKAPSDTFTGDVSAVATDDQEYRVNGFISGPISDKVDFSISAYGTTLNQPIKNLLDDKHTTQEIEGVRAKVLIKATDDLDVTLVGHYGHSQSQGFNLAYTYVTPGTTLLVGIGGPPFLSAAALMPGVTPSLTNTNYVSPVNSGAHINDTDFSAIVNYRLPGGFTVGSTTAYQHETQDNVQDLFAVGSYFWNELTGAGTPGNPTPPFFNFQEQKENVEQLSEEAKLVSPAGGVFNYVIGVFYSATTVETSETRGLLPAFLTSTVTPDTKTTDLYGRSTWKFLPSTSLVTGLRYNYDDVSYTKDQALYTAAFPPPVIQGPISATGSHTSSTVVGDISLQQQIQTDSMVYATYARGYSPGAYNTAQGLIAPGLFGAGTPGQPTLAYVPNETINHVELGTKGTYLDNSLTVNVSVWDTKYKDFQVQIFDTSTGSVDPPLVLTPAGGAETKGLEFDAVWAATKLLTLNFDYAYVDAKFTEYPGAPCWYGESAAQGCTLKNPALAPSPLNPTNQNLSGAVMPNAPKNKFVIGAQQRVPLGSMGYDLVLGGNYSYTAQTQMLADQNPESIRPSYGLMNLSAGLRSQTGKFSATFFVDNVLNKHYLVDMEDFWSSPWGSTNVVVSQPARDTNRYAGIRLTAGF
jgi:iron complex outermembrane receptor protein